MKEQTSWGWAICSDSAGVLLNTTSMRRTDAIEKFMDILEGNSWDYNGWRRAKKNGWRASRVQVSECLFGKGEQP